jgi:hypothetical protein
MKITTTKIKINKKITNIKMKAIIKTKMIYKNNTKHKVTFKTTFKSNVIFKTTIRPIVKN